MDEYQDYVPFDEKRDWEDGQYIDGEFVSRGLKRGRQQSKEDAIYGVFGEESDDDDRPRGRRGMGRKEPDLTRPVGFVSKGVDNSKNNVDYTKVEVNIPAGGQEGSGGLGLRPSFASSGRMEEEEGEDDEAEVLATGLGSRIKKQVAGRRQAGQEERELDKQWQKAKSADPSFATFEKHTKGIGMKLLSKMGFKPGEGLGAGKGGIAKPIEVTVRPRGQALGFGSRHNDDDEDDNKEEGGRQSANASTSKPEAAAMPGGSRMWKKKNKDARTKREYRTAEDLVAEASKHPLNPVALNPILDMRGPQGPRLLTSLDRLNDIAEEDDYDPRGKGKGKTPMPELQHNLQLLVDMCEAGIHKLDSQLRHEEDTRVLLQRELERHKKEEERARLESERLEKVFKVIERFQPTKRQLGKGHIAMMGRAKGAAGEEDDGLGRPTFRKAAPAAPPPSLKDAEEAFRLLLTSYPEEYLIYRLSTVALAHILPRFKSIFLDWQPLEEPKRGLSEFKTWRPLLETPTGPFSTHGSSSRRDPLGHAMGGLGRSSLVVGVDDDSYLSLVWEVFLPPVRNACVSSWQAKDPEPLLTLLEEWSGLLPPSAMSHVLQLIVMPRLSAAVDEWEPRKDSVMIHIWLHPWLPLLGPQIEGLYPPIRHKLAVALQSWHPSDPSTLAILEPWSKAFSSSDWEALMMKCIVPKLAMALQLLVVDPTSQDLTPFEWFMSWLDLLPLYQSVALLEQGFFPKWQRVLNFWLSHSPDYDEVTRWYLGWKSLFPPVLLEQPKVKKQFNTALNAMNSAVDGKVPPAPDARPPGAQAPNWTDEEMGEEGSRPYVPPSDLSLRELVQRFAEEHGVEFMPKFGRFHDGLQVYTFAGKINVILENTTSMVRAQVKDKWVPASLESLLQQAKSAAAK